MRATEIMLFILCFNAAIPLVATTGIWLTGPEGTSIISGYLILGGAAAALSAGGVSIMGWSFKVPATITVFAAIYGASIAALDVLIFQLISPWGVAAIFSGVFTILTGVVGVIGVLQIAGGAQGPMD